MIPGHDRCESSGVFLFSSWGAGGSSCNLVHYVSGIYQIRQKINKHFYNAKAYKFIFLSCPNVHAGKFWTSKAGDSKLIKSFHYSSDVVQMNYVRRLWQYFSLDYTQVATGNVHCSVWLVLSL